MKILVLSDIHAFKTPVKGRRNPSHVEVGSEECSLLAFDNLIKEKNWNDIDYILALGDFSDQANADGIKYVWRKLNSIADKSVNCKLLATAGNHDIDSRFINSDFCPKDTLLSLKPRFPCVTKDKKCHFHKDDFERQLWFWARNFYMHSSDECRFLALNSAAYHGQGKDNNEFEHGRISSYTLESIKEVLNEDETQRKNIGVPLPKFNILMCHHHLQPDGKINDPDSSSMKGAHALTEFLNNREYGRWLFVHGHKHLGRLSQIEGAYVLSASSFGVNTSEKNYDFSNQVHFIELDFQAMESHKFYPAGKISSLTWTRGAGWTDTSPSAKGMPKQTSFGFVGNIDEYVTKISSLVKNKSGVSWEKVLLTFPELAFLDYVQIDQLAATLTRNTNAELSFSHPGLIEFVLPQGKL